MKTTTALLLAASLATAPAITTQPAQGETAMTDHAHDFDFLVGKWHVRHHRLKARLAGSHEWEDFDGTSQMWMTMDGQGTFDDNYIGIPSGPYRAVGIRGYDPKTQTWAIWWLDGRNPHTLEKPVIGNFQNGIGIFETDDIQNGKHVIVRFTWSHITHTSAHWEQAFSPDGGKTWEMNWAMELTRVE
jgi:hypothetical protein